MGVSTSTSLESTGKPLINVASVFQPQNNTIITNQEIIESEAGTNTDEEMEMKKELQQKVKIPIQIEKLTGADPIYLEFTKV